MSRPAAPPLPLHAAAAAAGLAAALAVPPPLPGNINDGPRSPRWLAQSLSKGAAGVAVLHGVRAQDGAGPTGPVHAWLARAVREELSATRGAGLWFGAPAVGFAIAVAAPGQYPRALAALDAAVARLVDDRLAGAAARMAAGLRPELAEFDLVRGLTGLGAYLLHRDPGGDRLRRVLAYLVRLRAPTPAGDAAGRAAPGWWTNDIPYANTDPALADGHANLGMAHGISGPLTLLALAIRHGVIVDGHADALNHICGWLDAWRHDGPAGPWWPERVTLADLRAGSSAQAGPLRPSWCYGTPGLARAQQLAALALGDPARQDAAEHALVRCLADPVQRSRIVDPALCHGWAGLVATTWCAAADARTPALAGALPDLVAALVDHASDTTTAHSGLIEGGAGVALTLHALVSGPPGPWLACLLLA